METLEQKIAALTAKHAEQVAKETRAETARAALLAAWPELPVTKVNGFAYLADAWAELDCETLGDAITWAEKMNPEALFRVKDSCLSYRPEYATPEGTPGEVAVIGCYYLTVDKFSERYPLTVKLSWYVVHDGHKIRVDANVKDTRDFRVDADISYTRRGEPICRPGSRRLTDNSGAFTKTDRFWSPEDSPGRYVRYLG